MNDKTANNSIRQLRDSKKLTQRQLAKAIGVTPAVIARYELGTLKPTEARAAQLAEVLDTTVEFILSSYTPKQEWQFVIPSGAVTIQDRNALSDFYKFEVIETISRTPDEMIPSQISASIISDAIYMRSILIRLCNGICPNCGNPASFSGPDDLPYMKLFYWGDKNYEDSHNKHISLQQTVLCPTCWAKLRIYPELIDTRKIQLFNVPSQNSDVESDADNDEKAVV